MNHGWTNKEYDKVIITYLFINIEVTGGNPIGNHKDNANSKCVIMISI